MDALVGRRREGARASRQDCTMRAMRLIVMVTGAAPGLGKSTLVRRLVDELSHAGRAVAAFPEEEIVDRDEFAAVMAAVRTKGVASPDQLLEASRAYVATCRNDLRDVVVQDMLFPYLPSLFAWGHTDDEIVAFFHDLADVCRDVRLVQIHLDGDPAESLPRAMAREDEDWLPWMIAKVGSYLDATDPVTDLESLVSHLRRATTRARRLVDAAPWPVFLIEADGADRTTDAALEALGPLLP